MKLVLLFSLFTHFAISKSANGFLEVFEEEITRDFRSDVKLTKIELLSNSKFEGVLSINAIVFDTKSQKNISYIKAWGKNNKLKLIVYYNKKSGFLESCKVFLNKLDGVYKAEVRSRHKQSHPIQDEQCRNDQNMITYKYQRMIEKGDLSAKEIAKKYQNEIRKL